MTIREKALAAVEEYINDNIENFTEDSHESDNHMWIEITKDGLFYETEEVDINTRHWYSYPDEEIEKVLTIAHGQLCNCELCCDITHIREYLNDEITKEELMELLNIDEDGTNHILHMYENESFYTMASEYGVDLDIDYLIQEMTENIKNIHYGYFNDEE